MSVLAGTWDVAIATPVGRFAVVFEIEECDGHVSGRAISDDETLTFIDPQTEDDRLRFSLRMTKPMRLVLRFDVTVDGDAMVGVSKAGLLPRSHVTGRRLDAGDR